MSKMSLQVLKAVPTSSPLDLIRLFHQGELEWCRHLGEETELDFGRWITNPDLPQSTEVNCLLDAFVLPGTSAAEIIDKIDIRANHLGVSWRNCTLSPTLPHTGLPEALIANSWWAFPRTIYHRTRTGAPASNPPAGVTIIPARASFKHYKQLADAQGVDPDTALLHLDDSHLDALLALEAGQPIGSISVLTSGEVGTIREWYVTPGCRRRGLGRVLLDRALEICARAVLKQVMLAIPDSSEEASRLCQTTGFAPVGQITSYRR